MQDWTSPFHSPVSPLVLWTLRLAGTGTSPGYEDKREPHAQQKTRILPHALPLSFPRYLNLLKHRDTHIDKTEPSVRSFLVQTDTEDSDDAEDRPPIGLPCLDRSSSSESSVSSASSASSFLLLHRQERLTRRRDAAGIRQFLLQFLEVLLLFRSQRFAHELLLA